MLRKQFKIPSKANFGNDWDEIKVKEEDFMDITMQQVEKYELSASSDHSTSMIQWLHEKWSSWIYSDSSLKQLHRLIHMTAASYKKNYWCDLTINVPQKWDKG